MYLILGKLIFVMNIQSMYVYYFFNDIVKFELLLKFKLDDGVLIYFLDGLLNLKSLY